MPTNLQKARILATELFEDSLLWRECRCNSPFNQTPLVRLGNGGNTPISVGVQGLVRTGFSCAKLTPQTIVSNKPAMAMNRNEVTTPLFDPELFIVAYLGCKLGGIYM
jgi:hypothetical protein